MNEVMTEALYGGMDREIGDDRGGRCEMEALRKEIERLKQENCSLRKRLIQFESLSK